MMRASSTGSTSISRTRAGGGTDATNAWARGPSKISCFPSKPGTGTGPPYALPPPRRATRAFRSMPRFSAFPNAGP